MNSPTACLKCESSRSVPCQWYFRRHSFGRFPEQRQRCLVWIPTVSRLLQQGRHGRANAAATGLKRAAPSRHLRSTCECYNVVDPSAGRRVLQRHAVASGSAKGCYFMLLPGQRGKSKMPQKRSHVTLSASRPQCPPPSAPNSRSAQHRPMKALFYRRYRTTDFGNAQGVWEGHRRSSFRSRLSFPSFLFPLVRNEPKDHFETY